MAVTDLKNFNVLDVELKGSNLIEAAAGTGKTYSIAIMVLRWILQTENKIDSVLAVTFTNYATAELKERILGFLEEALSCITEGTCKDSTIKEVCERYADKKNAAAKLRTAINDFDTSSIFTIHGFCRKLIREHAFELGIDFDMKLSEETETTKEVATTFFRENISYSNMFEDDWKLYEVLKKLSPSKQNTQSSVRDDFATFISKAGIGIGNSKIKISSGKNHETNDRLTRIYKNLVESAPKLAQKNRDRKNVMGYDDILLILYDLLQDKGKEQIVKNMEERYSLVLIDEFQDTDPLQYFIFKRLFLNGLHTVFFIGDPKQSIYAFRKADIFTYFETANSPGIKKYVMGKNFRSSQCAIEATNEVFSPKDIFGDDSLIKYEAVTAAKKSEEYALLFKGNPFYGLLVRKIPKQKTQKEVDKMIADLISRAIFELIKKDSSFKIKETVKNGEKNETLERTVKPSDIAILVDKNDFALELCSKLKEAGFPTTVEADSIQLLYIFASDEAAAMQKLIHAATTKGVAEFKMLLMTFFYNKTVTEIASGDKSFSDLHEKFRECFNEWEKRGFYSVFSKFIENKEILANIVGKGEKTIGILRQLSELINKHEFEEGFSPIWTQKWFDDKMRLKRGSEDENIRTEGGKNDCIKIMTLHKSKGLEFNIVFFPMKLKEPYGSDWLTRHKKTENGYEKEMIFTPLKEMKCNKPDELPDDEKLEENRRIYVGLTRAKYLTVCHIHNDKESSDSLLLFKKESSSSIKTSVITENDYEPAKFEQEGEITVKTELFPQEISERKIRPEWAISSFSSINQHTPAESGAQKDNGMDPDILLADFPSGAEAGTILHSIFEEADFKNSNDKLVKSTLKKKMAFKEEKSAEKNGKSELDTMSDAVLQCLKNVFSAPMFENGKALCDVPEENRITEMEFFMKTGSFEEHELSEAIKESYDTEDLGEGSIEKGFLHGFIDLVVKIGEKYYIIDWKSNNLGTHFSDYDKKNIAEEMKKHNYYLQYMLYIAAFDNYMQKTCDDYSYEKDFGGIKYVFLRGVQERKCETGIFEERPSESELRKIQKLLEGEK